MILNKGSFLYMFKKKKKAMERSKSVYVSEYCKTCHCRACETLNASTIMMTRCGKANKDAIYCNEMGCCHGCDCFIRQTCDSYKGHINSPYKCRCDCHCKEVVLVETKEKHGISIQTKLVFVPLKYNTTYKSLY